MDANQVVLIAKILVIGAQYVHLGWNITGAETGSRRLKNTCIVSKRSC